MRQRAGLGCSIVVLVTIGMGTGAWGKSKLSMVCPLLSRADIASIMGKPLLEKHDTPMVGTPTREGGCEWITDKGSLTKPGDRLGIVLREWKTRSKAIEDYEGERGVESVGCRTGAVAHVGEHAYHCFSNVTFQVGRFMGQLSLSTAAGAGKAIDLHRAVVASRRIATRLRAYR
jgi:hypothetical protein